MPEVFAKYYILKRRILEHPIAERAADLYRYAAFHSWFARYIRKLVGVAMEAAFLVLVVYLLCTGLLYLSQMMWELYQQTPMGRKFVETFDYRTHVMKWINLCRNAAISCEKERAWRKNLGRISRTKSGSLRGLSLRHQIPLPFRHVRVMILIWRQKSATTP